MENTIEFLQDNYFPEMDRIYINKKYTTETFPKWLFDNLPEDKKEIMYRSLKDLYRLGFR